MIWDGKETTVRSKKERLSIFHKSLAAGFAATVIVLALVQTPYAHDIITKVGPGPHGVGARRSVLPELAVVFTALLSVNLLGIAWVRRAPPPGPDGPPLASFDEPLRQTSGSLLQLQDEERRRIARELHDGTLQTLGAAAMALDNARRLAAPGTPQLLEALRESAELLDAAMQELRTQSYLLHPPLLEQLGLEAVLPWFAEGFARRSEIAVTVVIQPHLGRLPGPIELTLFRVAQEALTNIHRHSGSDTAEIVLRRTADRVFLDITDRGCGIAPNILTGQAGGAVGVGLAGLRDRVRHFGGRVEIASRGPGTRVAVMLPLTPVVALADDALVDDSSLPLM